VKHSTRIAIGYLGLSILWIAVSDPLFAALFPQSFPTISLYKGWIFVAATALLLKLWLGAEEARRDEVEARLQESAIVDPLTGLHNRAAFIDHLDHALRLAAREERRFGLLFIDVDNFKSVNDGHGHAIGDGLLREVARRIAETVRASDVAARLGGDEFVVLVDNGHDLAILGARLLAAMRHPYVIEDTPIVATVSIGYARYPDHGSTPDALLHAADVAMYRAKNEGRDCLVGAGD